MFQKAFSQFSVILILVSASFAQQPKYTATSLDSFVAVAINDRGQIVGNNFLGNYELGNASVWDNGTITEIPPLDGDAATSVADINNNGVVVGFSHSDTDMGGKKRIMVFRNNKTEPVIHQNFDLDPINTFITSINDSNIFIGAVKEARLLFYYNVNTSEYKFIDYTSIDSTALFGLFTGINNNGTIVGYLTLPPVSIFYNRGFTFKNDTLSFLPEDMHSFFPSVINNPGFIGGQGDTLDSIHTDNYALAYFQDEIIRLGTFCSWTQTLGINNANQIVGSSKPDLGWSTPPWAFLWQNGTFYCLNDLTDPWIKLNYAVDINNKGQIIATSSSNKFESFLLDPENTSIGPVALVYNTDMVPLTVKMHSSLIRFQVPDNRLSISLIDLKGRIIIQPFRITGASQERVILLKDHVGLVSSGMYLLQVTAGTWRSVKKIILD